MDPDRITRRRTLAALASTGTAALVGCVEGTSQGQGPGTDTPVRGRNGTVTPTQTHTPTETPTDGSTETPPPEETCGTTFADGFERETLGGQYVRERMDGRAELTDQHAHGGGQSLLMASETHHSVTFVRTRDCFQGELEISAALKRIADAEEKRGTATAAALALVDAETNDWPRITVSVQRKGDRLTVRQFNDRSRVTTIEHRGASVPLQQWTDVALTVGQGSLDVRAGSGQTQFVTETDWATRPFRVGLRLRDSGEADGITAAFDDLTVEPA